MLRKSFFLIALMFLCSSCALVDKELSLDPSDAQYSGEKTDKTLYIYEFEDKRSIEEKVGVVKNSYGQETADVTLEQDISALIENSLINNLNHAGFNVKKVISTSSGGLTLSTNEISLKGEIFKFYVEPDVGFWYADMVADINVKIKARSRNESFSESYCIQSKDPEMEWGTSRSYERSLETSLEKLSEQITADIVYFVNK